MAKRPLHAGPGYIETTLNAVLPWLFFSLVTVLFLYTYQEAPTFVWLVLASCGALALALVLLGLGGGQRKLLAVGSWCLCSLALAYLLGHFLDMSYLQRETRLEMGKELGNVDPASLAAIAGDVATVRFSNGTFVDDRRTVGYVAEGQLYCVAPISKHAAPADPAIYWAVGVNCCERRSNFDCGTSRLPIDLAGVSYSTDSDAVFEHAVKLAASVYGVMLPDGPPKLLHFGGEPSKVASALRSEAVNIAGLAVATHFFWCLVVSVAIGTASGGAQTEQAGDTVLRGGTLRDAIDMATDPFLRGGAKRVAGGPARPKRRPGGGRKTRDVLAAQEQEQEGASLPGDGFSETVTGTEESDPEQGRSWASFLVDTESKSMQEREHDTWDRNKERVHMFDTLYIASDGGFSEVKETFDKKITWFYYLMALATPILVCYNISYVLMTDIHFIKDRHALSSLDSMYVLTTGFLLRPVMSLVSKYTHQEVPELPATLVFAVAELLFVGFKVLFLCVIVVRVFFITGYKKWRDVSRIFFEKVPELATVSAMMLLSMVVPAQFMKDFKETSRAASDAGISAVRRGGILTWFIMVRAVCLMIGFDAFLVKFRLASAYMNADGVTLENILGAGNFVLQITGVVQIDFLLRSRLMVFVFAGPDGAMDADDKAKHQVYFALLVKRIYEEMSPQSIFRFLAVMLNFDDYDFQSLVLNTGSRGPDDPELESKPLDSEAEAPAARQARAERKKARRACC